MEQYGYVDPVDPSEPQTNIVGEDRVKKYISRFQSSAGLPETGKLDSETVTLMNTPRCGSKDDTAEFSLHGSKWQKKHLTYRISKYPTSRRMSKKDTDNVIAQAFQVNKIFKVKIF